MQIPASLTANAGRPAQLADSILQPESLRACEESLKPEAIRRMWPREVAEKSFIDYLWSQYDYTQLGAIEARPSACKRHADKHAAPLKMSVLPGAAGECPARYWHTGLGSRCCMFLQM